jgi:hypothetical protein
MAHYRDLRHAIATAALLAACLLLAGAEGASAGEYHVYSCRMPNEEVAPTDGWSGTTSVAAAVHAENKCAKRGALVAALGDGIEHLSTDIATWTFSTPVGETMAAATIWRAGDADGGWTLNAPYEFWLARPEDVDNQANVIDQCVAEFGCPTGLGNPGEIRSSSNAVTVLPEPLDTHLYINASCGASGAFKCPPNAGDTNHYAAVVYLYAADILLEQTSQPTVTPGSVSGELVTASSVSGTVSLGFEAKDSGSGVYQAVFAVDGAEVGRTVLDENGGHCRNVGQTSDGLPAFLYLKPCKAALSADVPFNTTALANGAHQLVVDVTDAAGNPAVALDRKITVDNPLPPSGGGTTTGNPSPSQNNPAPQLQGANGTNASAGARLSVRWSSTSKASLKGRYGRAQTVLGRLTAPGGAPIAGALVEAAMTPSAQGARSTALASPRTASNGTFRLRLPAGAPSGRVVFAYRSRLGGPVPDALAALALTVPAGLSLSVAPRVSHAGGTIAFRGVLHGSPIPPGGKQLVLQARTLGSGWRTFDVLSTDRHGRYRATYRFRLAGPVTYEFRAVSPHEADFPFAAGASNVVRVIER